MRGVKSEKACGGWGGLHAANNTMRCGGAACRDAACATVSWQHGIVAVVCEGTTASVGRGGCLQEGGVPLQHTLQLESVDAEHLLQPHLRVTTQGEACVTRPSRGEACVTRPSQGEACVTRPGIRDRTAHHKPTCDRSWAPGQKQRCLRACACA
eukprot:698796-Prymnesium_polylepis.2